MTYLLVASKEEGLVSELSVASLKQAALKKKTK